MKDLVLIGASGVAHEILDTVGLLQSQSRRWKNIYVLDDDPEKTGSEFYLGFEIRGTSAFIEDLNLEQSEFLVTFSSPALFLAREQYVENLKKRYPAIQFATICDPEAYISPTAQVGCGSYLARGSIIDSKAVVGEHVIVLFHSVVSRYVHVGSYSFVSASVNIVGGCQLGKSLYLGAKSTIHAQIGNSVFVDSHVCVKSDLPDNMVVSAQSELRKIPYASSEKMRGMMERFK